MFRKIYCPKCERLARDMRDFMVEIVDHLKARQIAAKNWRTRVRIEGDPLAGRQHGRHLLMAWVALGLTAETAVFVLAGFAWFLSREYTIAEAGAGAVVTVFMVLSLIHQISLFTGSFLPGFIWNPLPWRRVSFSVSAGCRNWSADWRR